MMKQSAVSVPIKWSPPVLNLSADAVLPPEVTWKIFTGELLILSVAVNCNITVKPAGCK